MNNSMIPRSGSARGNSKPQATPCSAYELKRARMLNGAKMKLSLAHAFNAALVAFLRSFRRDVEADSRAEGIARTIRLTTRC